MSNTTPSPLPAQWAEDEEIPEFLRRKLEPAGQEQELRACGGIQEPYNAEPAPLDSASQATSSTPRS